MMPKMMRGEEFERWSARNLRENTGYALKEGDGVKDVWWREGVVTGVVVWEGEASPENHGVLYVRLKSGVEESYSLFGWEAKFRVTRL